MERPTRQATLCEIIDRTNNQILLPMKKRGFGKGMFNGYGGKVMEGESVESAMIGNLKKNQDLMWRGVI